MVKLTTACLRVCFRPFRTTPQKKLSSGFTVIFSGFTVTFEYTPVSWYGSLSAQLCASEREEKLAMTVLPVNPASPGSSLSTAG